MLTGVLLMGQLNGWVQVGRLVLGQSLQLLSSDSQPPALPQPACQHPCLVHQGSMLQCVLACC
jgi:hypothetical protein